MKRIIIHWTGGTFKPNSTDLIHYHFLVNGAGEVVTGNYKPEDNENCSDGCYARHCGGGNTGSIGIALCGMYGYKNRMNCGTYLINRVQCEKLFDTVADLCLKYSIKVTPETVLTHYEFNQQHNIKTGKIDITYLPCFPQLFPEEIGSFIRSKINWYLAKKRQV